MPCGACRPPWPDELGDGEPVRFEFPRHTFDRCPDAEAAIAKLTTIRKSDGSVEIRMPAPVRELLAAAAVADPEFTQQPKLTERWA
jgi:hypothetical protein